MFKQAIVDWAKTRYRREHRHMMRLWRASWRFAPFISIVAFLSLALPGSILGYWIGHQMNVVNITNNIPNSPAPVAPNPPQLPAPSVADPTFSSSTGGEISGRGMTINGQPPFPFAKTETGGKVIMDNATINVSPSGNWVLVPDGTFKNLSNQDLAEHLLESANKFREDQNPSDWISFALEVRPLCTEALWRVKTLNTVDTVGGFYVILINVPNREAAVEAAKFIEALAGAVKKL